ncbi:MAG: oxygenase MpaB family protein [Actinomycetes bacterium]
MKRRIANRFRQIVSGSPDGRPDWVKQIEIGDDVGLFGVDSPVWKVHGDIATLVGGVRALLLQAAHPAALTGVAEHSRYETDPLGRLAGTSRWLTITTFGSTEAIAREAARVNEMHKRVTGDYQSKSGSTSPYKASDPRYLLWVHCAFTDSFLQTHLEFHPSFGDGDEYVRQWSKSAVGLGLTSAPQSMAELKAVMDNFADEELAPSQHTANVVRFILKPPLGIGPLIFYRFLAKSAVYSLTPKQREILGLKQVSKAWVVAATFLLGVLSWTLGNESPSQEVARARIARIEEKKI